jgi:UDP-2,4-diacetamido-2,4,6-trideoxy-beta-L-altropyranose hydrolase
MRVLIRADGGASIGLGHLTRCLALAVRLRARGAEVVFVTSPADPAVLDKIRGAGCLVEPLPKDCDEDAAVAFLLAVAAKRGAPLIVVDSYRIELKHQVAIKGAGLKLLAVDDFGTGRFAADFVFNPNLTARAENYSVDAGARLLLGPAYALLRPEFLEAAGRPAAPSPDPRILITMGGSDPSGLTREAWKILDAAPGAFALDLLVGAAYPEAGALARDVAAARHATVVHHDPPDVPGLMRRATLAVSAAGSTCWELACLGVPSIVLVTADNQKGVAEGLVKSGFAVCPGGISAAAKEAAALLTNQARLKAMSAAGKALVDGRGAERVAEAVLA